MYHFLNSHYKLNTDKMYFITLSLLLPILILFHFKKSRNPKPVSKLPPGPKTLPVIGHMHLVGALPFRSFAGLSKLYGPIMRLKLGEVETIVVSSPEITREILKENEPCYADRPESVSMKFCGMITATSPSAHTATTGSRCGRSA